MYQWAKSVGEDFTAWAYQIYTILQVATDCSTLPPSDKSRELIPWASVTGAGGTVISGWLDYAGEPVAELGVDGNYCIDTTTGDIYKKSAGSWGSPLLNIMGPAGDTGAGAETGNIEYGYTSGSSTVTATQKISEFNIYPATVFPNNGDSILITADLTVSQPANFPQSKTIMNISLMLKSNRYAETRIEATGKIRLWAQITRASSTELFIVTEHSSETVLLSDLLEAGLINGGVYIQKSSPYGSSGDVVVNQLTINAQKMLL